MPLITILPNRVTVSIPSGDRLLPHIKKYFGQKNDGLCDGYAQCRKCLIKIVSGDHNLSEVTEYEIKLLGNVTHISHERLACNISILGDVVIEIPDVSSTIRPKTKLRKKDDVIMNKAKKEEIEDNLGKDSGHRKMRYPNYNPKKRGD